MSNLETAEAKIAPSLITVLRVLWVVLFAFLLLLFIGGSPLFFQKKAVICEGANCPIQVITAQEASLLEGMGLSLSFYAGFLVFVELVVGLGMAGLAILIFVVRFHEKVGIILAFMLLLTGLNFMVEADNAFVAHYPMFAIPYYFVSSMTLVPFILLFYLFPDGRFTPRWTRPFVFLFVTVLTIISLFYDFVNDSSPGPWGIALSSFFILFVLGGVAAQIYRYRWVSSPLQRQQTKWVILGFLGLMFVLINYYLWYVYNKQEPGFVRLFLFSGFYGFMALFLVFFPVTFVIAMLRYRLWDIDIIIRRTVQYAAVSAVLAVVYYGCVLILQTLFTAVSGSRSPLIVVISTLVIAALFNPLRQRIQIFIDRRFYRRKYDAEQILTQFAQTARDEVELDKLTAEFVAVVSETMQPESISLWIKQ